MGKVSEVMTSSPGCIQSSTTLSEACQMMKDVKTGFLPVLNGGSKVAGVITDRDIAIKAIANGESPNETTVSDYMTKDVCCCYDDEDIDVVAQKMSENQLHRILVNNRDDEVVGVVSLRDMALHVNNDELCGSIVHAILKD